MPDILSLEINQRLLKAWPSTSSSMLYNLEKATTQIPSIKSDASIDICNLSSNNLIYFKYNNCMEARYFCQLTTTEVCGNGANQYKPIRREDYQWLIDSSSSCTTPSKRQSQQWQFQTPSRSSPSNCSFNSSCFSLSKYSSPLAISPTLPTTFSKNKAKRLMKQTFIEQKECSICLDIIKKQADLPCSHSYCLECLKEWLQNATKCPYCRAEVEFFTHEGQKVRVEPKEFEFEARTDELMDWLCYQCDHTQVGDTLLICDRCDAYACHVDCDQALNGIEPQGQWYCHYCR